MNEQVDTIDQLPEVRPSRKKYVRMYGVTTALVFVIMLLVTHMFREQLMEKNTLISLLTFVLLMLMIIFAQLQVRAKVYNGVMSYSQAFGTGLMVSIWSAFIYAVFAFIFYQFIAPHVLDEMLAYAEQKMREDGATDEMVDMAMKWTSWFMSPFGILFSTLFMHILMGMIASLLTSLFTQRQR